MEIPKEQRRNFLAFIWHAFWLALANTFAERNTVLPGLILFVGGAQLEVGVLTAITIGVPIFSQLAFAGYLSQKTYKKKFLLFGIYLRVAAFIGTVWTLTKVNSITPTLVITFVFIWMFIFSISGAFASVSYSDILGKSITGNTRKKFFVRRQFLSSIGILISALITREFLKGFEYPDNYIFMFSAASAMLFIASFGFAAIKETPTKEFRDEKIFLDVVKSIPKVLRDDIRFRYYIYLVNLTQLILTLIPFIVVLAQESIQLTKESIGNFLLFQILGMVLSNFIWNRVVRLSAFRGVYKYLIFIIIIIPLLALLASYTQNFYLFGSIFFLVGFAMSAFKIASEGMFLEITNNTNRAIYQGINGSLNLTVAFVPLISGVLINHLGFTFIFITASIIASYSVMIIPKIRCEIN